MRSFRQKKISKKWPLEYWEFEKKSQLFNLKSDFFLIFQIKTSKNSKIPKFYLSWTSSEPIFRKFRGTFFLTQSLTHSVAIRRHSTCKTSWVGFLKKNFQECTASARLGGMFLSFFLFLSFFPSFFLSFSFFFDFSFLFFLKGNLV